ncbi:MAG: fibro-slime domain-containing protein, partial [Eubacteriales bacterium]|nr:fibro-slime domain-containing protein [Eubacteriales bacterium]
TMLCGLIPAAVLSTQGADVANYVSLPITIRDYAADGMLFEWNETGTVGDTVYSDSTPTRVFTEQAGGGAYNATVYDSYVRYTSTSTGVYITYTLSGKTRHDLRYCVVKYRTNAAASSTPTIGHRWNNGSSNNYVDFDTSGYNKASTWTTVVIDLGDGTDVVSHVTLYPRLAKGKYIDIAYVAFFDKSEKATEYKNNGGKVTASATFHNGDTKGFGMLVTSDKDHFNDLPGADNAIAGTSYFINGKWGDTTQPTAAFTTLNSGAPQTVYGALLRTNLVEATLDKNKRPVYTEAAVTYIANLLQKTLPEVWQNSDGSYNMWYVMGHKLSDLGGTDLATKLRSQITGLGTYADAKAKYDNGSLTKYTQVTTYFDAAYFLLHNTFDDSIGYGKTVAEYNTLRLVAKQVDGRTVYVFNSGYDGTVYDPANGIIYNTQTDTITARKKNGTDEYVRGNILPLATFNPIAGMGYGNSGDTYRMARDGSQENYYNDTNYNLTLEGHAQFIYYQDADLYFNFTGDDDVYLYINGIRVLDMGGAHSISKAGISLNNVAEICGLKDGEVYDFDFYYMERHGTAANFSIETNIKVVDASMLTEKIGYQNGISTGYNGYVNPNKPVIYEYALTNNGKEPILNLTFDDPQLGISLSKDSLTLNSETTSENLTATVYNRDGTVKEFVPEGTLNADKLKQLLATGLKVGEKISIYGFRHKVTDAEWTAGGNTFTNHVYTTSKPETRDETLNGLADWKVKKRTFDYEGFHIYEWVGKSVTVTKEELIQLPNNGGYTFSSAASIIPCTASGKTTTSNWNPNATLNADGSITYTGTKTGADAYYYMLTEGSGDSEKKSDVICVSVYSYDAADNTYVIDYGLSVELNGEGHGLTLNDTLNLSANPYTTASSITGIQDATRAYGSFTWASPSLKYTPSKIINDTDSVRVNVRVIENGASSLTKFTGVDMYETITVAPANVMYYEDNFPDITYVSQSGNSWAVEKEAAAGTEQSADQQSNYGSDPNYAADITPSAITGDASNGTLHTLNVVTTGEVMSFDFRGTGFEILSRTTKEPYAVINVLVYNTSNLSTPVAVKPVITESKGGDLYQIPVISITGLPQGEYHVSVMASAKPDARDRVFYVDGLRIYEPLTAEDANTYYNPEEAGATFTEIKALIGEGRVVYSEISAEGDETKIISGNATGGAATVIENRGENGLVLVSDDFGEYMTFGPNNEIYLQGNSVNNVIAFLLTPDRSVPEAARTIEIGAHRKSDSLTGDTGAINLVYGSTAEAIMNGTYSHAVASGTEQYYTIDVNHLIKNADGSYLVMIGTNGSVNGTDVVTLSLTNLKISGYTLKGVGIIQDAEANTLQTNTVMAGLMSLRTMVYEAANAPEVQINAGLGITSASLNAKSVVSGKQVKLTVKATAGADELVVLDSEGNRVEFTKCTSKKSRGVVTFTAKWEVTGSVGEVMSYTVIVYDSDGARSVNTETVNVTVKKGWSL